MTWRQFTGWAARIAVSALVRVLEVGAIAFCWLAFLPLRIADRFARSAKREP